MFFQNWDALGFNGEYHGDRIWLVVSTPLKNIGQLGSLFPIYGKIKNVSNHQPAIIVEYW